MRKLAVATAAIGLLGAFAAETPAFAAMGQCFDAYGRPASQPYDTDNPNYGMICSVYRRGGTCTGVSQQWADGNCGLAPRYQYRDDGYRYRDDGYRGRRYNQAPPATRPGETDQQRAARDFKNQYGSPTWDPVFRPHPGF